MIMNALTVDVEEYYHAAIFQKATRGLTGRTFESRVEGSMEQLLALLARISAGARFSCSEKSRAAHPSLVRGSPPSSTRSRATAIGTTTSYRQRPREFRADVGRAKARHRGRSSASR